MPRLHNIAYHTPVIGAIRMGHMEEISGKRLPKKDDFFTITELYKQNNKWVSHELHKKALNAQPQSAEDKLRSIPVKLLYSNPDLNATERFEAYSLEKKRIVCAGDGVNANRIEDDGSIRQYECAGSDYCKFGQANRCGVFGRSFFKIEGQQDDSGAFIIRSGGYNSFTTIRTRVEALFAKFGEKVRHIPLKLVLRTKSSIVSMNTAFYYPDLVVDGNEIELARKAAEQLELEKMAGIDYAKFESTMLELRANGGLSEPGESFDDREEFINPDMVVVASEGMLSLQKPFDVEIPARNAATSVAVSAFPPRKNSRKNEVQNESSSSLLN